MMINRATIARWSAFAAAAAMMLPDAAGGHAGEDHSKDAPATAAPIAVAGMQGDVLTSSATTDYFELVAKYPATAAGSDTRMRLFVADFATNTPISNAGLSLSFRPDGAEVRSAPKMISPGIYDLVVRFPRDTVYALVATVTAGQRTDFVEVRNLYAGTAAEDFLAEHGTPANTAAVDAETNETSWLLPALIAGALVLMALTVVVVRRRRSRTQSASVARDPELAPRPDRGAPPETANQNIG